MFRRIIFLSAICLLSAANPCWAGEPARLDFSTWEELPVYDDGRRMPLDTFARSVVGKICGRTRPKLDPPETPLSSEARHLFPDGKRRKFRSAELLFGWLVEPQVWESVPLIVARHEVIREELLGLRVSNRQGHRLKFVSPRQVADSPLFRSMYRDAAGEDSTDWEKWKERIRHLGLEKEVNELFAAYRLYRHLTFDPPAISKNPGGFFDRIAPLLRRWMPVKERLLRLHQGTPGQGSGPPIGEVSQAVGELHALQSGGGLTLQQADAAMAKLCRSAAELARLVDAECRRAFEDSSSGPAERARLNELAVDTAELAAEADRMHLALYDGGRSLRLVPALNPAALRAERSADDRSQPWLNLQTLRFGSAAILHDYPQTELEAVRKAFERVGRTYADREKADRPQQFAAAMRQFAAAARALGERIEPIREQLPIEGTREDVARTLADTAYPPGGFTRTELRYNRVDPILWSWVICLLATVWFALGFGRLRRPMFWLGIATLALAQAFIVYGLSLRAAITGWVPVTNMFETIVFVGLAVAAMGTWFALSPVLLPGIVSAWRMAAIPEVVGCRLYRRWWALLRQRQAVGHESSAGESASALQRGAEKRPAAEAAGWLPAANWILLLPRVGLMVWIFRALTIECYGSGGEQPIIRLWPRTRAGSWLPGSLSDLLAWVVGLSVAAVAVWLGPRLIVALVLAPATVVHSWLRQTASGVLEEVLRRRLFVMIGAAGGFLFCLLAYNWPAEAQSMGGMKAILRDNFWLTVHVLSITASYGAGALAWGMGNIALAYYLFGRYREAATSSGKGAGRGLARRPPEACARLAGFTYRAVQVAVVLLASGTILGALWADVAWGRFWGWDAKEVWSLISLLAYSVILHGRRIGWSGNFGMAVGAVLGATSIAMAWYGVNYVLGSGLHTYGGGAGGGLYVITLAVCNWGFVAVAGVRYGLETRRNEKGFREKGFRD